MTGDDTPRTERGDPTSSTGAAATQAFYTRWARLYDAIASYTPGVRGLRRNAAATLDLEPGDTVVEFGCGTGANFPFLRAAVGAEGTVVGVDFTPGMVARASRRTARWENVHVIRGDAVRPPVVGAAENDETAPDAVFASFLAGMLEDPAAAVETWRALLTPGGRIALLDLVRSTGAGRPLNPAFAHVVRLSAPPGGDASARTLAATLDERVAAAHRAVLDGDDADHETAMLGFVRLSAATRPP